jgi:hypothetical protein
LLAEGVEVVAVSGRVIVVAGVFVVGVLETLEELEEVVGREVVEVAAGFTALLALDVVVVVVVGRLLLVAVGAGRLELCCAFW